MTPNQIDLFHVRPATQQRLGQGLLGRQIQSRSRRAKKRRSASGEQHENMVVRPGEGGQLEHALRRPDALAVRLWMRRLDDFHPSERATLATSGRHEPDRGGDPAHQRRFGHLRGRLAGGQH